MAANQKAFAARFSSPPGEQQPSTTIQQPEPVSTTQSATVSATPTPPPEAPHASAGQQPVSQGGYQPTLAEQAAAAVQQQQALGHLPIHLQSQALQFNLQPQIQAIQAQIQRAAHQQQVHSQPLTSSSLQQQVNALQPQQPQQQPPQQLTVHNPNQQAAGMSLADQTQLLQVSAAAFSMRGGLPMMSSSNSHVANQYRSGVPMVGNATDRPNRTLVQTLPIPVSFPRTLLPHSSICLNPSNASNHGRRCREVRTASRRQVRPCQQPPHSR